MFKFATYLACIVASVNANNDPTNLELLGLFDSDHEDTDFDYDMGRLLSTLP